MIKFIERLILALYRREVAKVEKKYADATAKCVSLARELDATRSVAVEHSASLGGNRTKLAKAEAFFK